jgi:hypothetical protein
MHRVCFFVCLCWGPVAMGAIVDSPIFINEFHYDNVGTDKEEFVEVAAPVAWSDLSEATLTLYNGGNGQSYASPMPLSSFTRRGVTDGWAFYTWDVSLQNGAPDGLALALRDQVLQFLSYEGTFTAVDGSAAGLNSTDVGVLELPDSPLGTSLQLTGRGDSYADFSWARFATNTYGAVNSGQSFVPEPATLVSFLVGAGGLSLAGWWRKRRVVSGA